MAISYTKTEERIHSISHGVGLLLGIVVGGFLLEKCYRENNFWAQVGVWLYLAGMLGSYLSSTLYHAIAPCSVWKEKLRKWDHAAIYWHIAGSYSPLTLVALRQEGYWGWSLFVFVWLCALGGTVMSFRKLKEHSNVETFCFVAMGMVIMVAFKPLVQVVSFQAVAWIIAEGVCYITGALFYSLHRKKYMHAVFHLFVLAGSICHIVAVWKMLAQHL